jgi:hypothetical protein
MGTEDMMEKSHKGKQGQVTIRMSPRKMVLVRQMWDTRPLTMALVLLSFYTILPWFNGESVILSMPSSRDLVSANDADISQHLQLVVNKKSALRGAGSIFNMYAASKVHSLPEEELELHAFLPAPTLQIAEDPEHIWAVPKEDSTAGNAKKDSTSGKEAKKDSTSGMKAKKDSTSGKDVKKEAKESNKKSATEKEAKKSGKADGKKKVA